MEAVLAAVAFILRQNLPDDIVFAPELKALPWSAQTRLRIEQRAARNGDKVTVTTAAAGIAETGTLLLDGRGRQPYHAELSARHSYRSIACIVHRRALRDAPGLFAASER